MRLDALIIFLIEWTQEGLILRGKDLKYWSQQLNIKTKKLIFLFGIKIPVLG